jgi:AraC-like DNA-binding protein
MTKRVGVGQFLAWNGGCLFIGHHDRILPLHSHQAIQLVVADDGDHRVRASDSEQWSTYSVAGIPTRHPHSLDVTDSNYGAVIFIEPETREGRAVTQRFLGSGIAEVGSDEVRELTRAIFARWLEGRKDEVVAAVRRLVHNLSEGVEPAVVTDPRILSAIDYINQNLSRPLTLDEVASHACLSPSRFRHLFSEQTSMGLRPYILWRRFILVWDLIMKGGSLSEAAHAAGFADSAHLSRTSTRNFGFAPSAMQLVLTPPDPQTLPKRTPRSATG